MNRLVAMAYGTKQGGGVADSGADVDTSVLE